MTSTKENIYSYGETNVVNTSILDQIGPLIYNNNFNKKTFKFDINLNNLNEDITKKYSEYNNEKIIHTKFIDKSLENFFNIDLIFKVYPNARIIHTFRNPVDSVISIYQSMLPDLSWTHSLEDILDYIDSYFKVINYFKKKYSNKIMNIKLENFTINNKKISKEIIKFCDLTWDEKILKFYERDNLHSKTLSFTQVRSKVKEYNKKKYEQYYHLLDKHKSEFSWLNI